MVDGCRDGTVQAPPNLTRPPPSKYSNARTRMNNRTGAADMKRILLAVALILIPSLAEAGLLKRVATRGKSVVNGVVRGGSCSGGACR